MQKQRSLILILAIILVLVIGYILWQAETTLDEVDEKMPQLGLNLAGLAWLRGIAKPARFIKESINLALKLSLTL